MGLTQSTMSSNQPGRGFLKVSGKDITLDGKPITLRGTAIGGWLNMENFITGYAGHEHQVRHALKQVLGTEKYNYFFEKFLEYFFAEDDAKFFASLGLNCIRIPVNYHHFEDDMNPRVFKKDGLKHLDRVIQICAKYGIYTVIDLHAAPGGQNFDWHSDNPTHKALFYEHKDFQDRTVFIWENLARHSKDNTWVAGYNPLNEPSDEQHVRLVAFYNRVEKAIRSIDSNHMLFLDGNTFAADFSRFGKPLHNCVYACHDYSIYGFPNPPSLYEGSKEQIQFHIDSFNGKTEYMRKHGSPVWVGEFGPVYQTSKDGYPDWKHINDTRFDVLQLQLDIYAKARASWSIWLYKDIGFQGMIYAGEDTAYVKLLKEFLHKKKVVAADKWGADDRAVRPLFTPVESWLLKTVPSISDRYPQDWSVGEHLSRLVRNMLLSEELVKEYAEHFRGKSLEELDELAKSFKFSNCTQRKRLNDVLKSDSERGTDEKKSLWQAGEKV
ncbi:expressed protein [Cryptococcus deneoformans JEC21]|uniref:Expressed protein n=1 Tax=Cryptococcus deneoformans (strain JEC21 / ATCC MYA-565) TaxID=214684 RepID=Q5KFD5_CRYD1|nr:expressed protein [Cryptococcus neoformans var. neoformans JEC21]AAW44253.2 expressed protein [Cryptococcus neoformans var. neoformans JEC21]